MSTRRGAERYWIKISASQQTIRNSRIHDVTRGAAVTRSFEQLIQFDKDIRDELTSKFFDEGFDLPPFPTENTATLIQEYIEALLKINQVVHSASILSWLKTDHADDTDDHRQLMYIQYLLPGIQDEPSFQTIPRIGTWNKTVPNICHGWWVVWCFRVEVMALPFTLHSFSKHQIELKLFITGLSLSTAAAVKCEIPSTSSRELVHQQMCHISESMFHGSYRLPTEDEGMFTASLEFSNIGTLSSILGIHRVAVECTSIPHEIFKAACEAAQDQNVFEQRRRQAPMLATIKDCDNLLNVEVQPWELLSAEKEDDVDTGVVKENNSTGLEGDTASSPMIYDNIEKLEREKYCLRAELDKFRQETETMKKKIRGMESERRVWQIAKGEVSREISSLIEDVTKERVDKDEIANKLHAAESEIYELRQQIDFKKFHDPKDIENDDEVLKITSALEGLARELHKSKLENYELRRKLFCTKTCIWNT